MAQRRHRMKRTEIAPGIERDALAALLERHGLGPLQTVELLAGGTVNPTLRVNNNLVVRCNRRDPELPKLQWEALIYRRLRQETDVPSPDVLALDTQRDLIGCDVLIMQYVEGVAASSVWSTLDPTTQEQLSEQLGRLCGAAHSLHWPLYSAFLTNDAPRTQSARWIDLVSRKIEAAYAQALTHSVFTPPVLDALVTTLNDGDAVYIDASPPTLTHTDLWLSNVIVRRSGAQWDVAAILDWEWSTVADGAWEFADLWSRPSDPYPLPGAFMYGYRERHPVPPDLSIRRRLYRMLHHFEVAARSAAAGDRDGTEFHRHAIERLFKARV